MSDLSHNGMHLVENDGHPLSQIIVRHFSPLYLSHFPSPTERCASWRVCLYEDTWGLSPGTLSGCFCIKTWMINCLCSGSLWQGQCKVQCCEVCWCDYWCRTACSAVRLDKKDMLSLPSSAMNNGLYMRAVHGNPKWPHLPGRASQQNTVEYVLSTSPGHQIGVVKYCMSGYAWFHFDKIPCCKELLFHLFQNIWQQLKELFVSVINYKSLSEVYFDSWGYLK